MAGLRSLAAEIGRFLAAGTGNTLLTIGIYQALVGFVSPSAAYAAAWAVGIVIVMTAYPRLVYRADTGWKQGGAIGLVYAVVFLIGLALTGLLERIGVPARLIIVLVAAVTASLSYAGGRLAVHRLQRALRTPSDAP